jgi:hypothetical protein
MRRQTRGHKVPTLPGLIHVKKRRVKTEGAQSKRFYEKTGRSLNTVLLVKSSTRLEIQNQ